MNIFNSFLVTLASSGGYVANTSLTGLKSPIDITPSSTLIVPIEPGKPPAALISAVFCAARRYTLSLPSPINAFINGM